MLNDMNKSLVHACMLHRLRKAHLDWPQTRGPGPGAPNVEGGTGEVKNVEIKADLLLSEPCQRVSRLLIGMSEEFEQTYKRVFIDMCNQLTFTSSESHAAFRTIIDELLGAAGGINWGRVVALVSFASSLAVHCVQKEMPETVDRVLEWTVEYLTSEPLRTWMVQNGGWEGFANFAECHSDCEESSWPSLKTICGCAVGALGVITLGAIFAQKS